MMVKVPHHREGEKNAFLKAPAKMHRICNQVDFFEPSVHVLMELKKKGDRVLMGE